MANHDDAALRQAADRIMAERQRWEGVGLLVLENLDTGACGVLLVPAGAPRPDWTDELLRAGGGWDRHEDLNLATWLQRWGAAVGADGTMRRWTEWMNLLHLHVPTALVAAMPAAQRRLACGHGFGVHAAPPVQDASELLGRLVAWLLPWERLAIGDGRHACAHWLGPQGVQQQWGSIGLADGAGARTRADRESAGGMVEWGVLAAWPSAVDAVVAFLLAQADSLGAEPTARAPAGRARRPGPLSKDRRHVVLVAVHEVVTGGGDMARPGKKRQEAAYRWACDNGTQNVHAALEQVRADWCPGWYVDWLRDEHGARVTVANLLGAVRDAKAFAVSVREGMTEKQRKEPRGIVAGGN